MGSCYYGGLYFICSCDTKSPFYRLGSFLNISKKRGLFALILIFVFQSSLFAKYLYKDEIVSNSKFGNTIELLGGTLYKKTGISLKVMMLRELPNGMTMYEYEKSILDKCKEPTILLSFSEMNQIVDIETNDKTLYKYFNKKQVLSPVTSYVQGFMMASFYARSWDEFKSMVTTTGGTILPLLGQKSKKMTVTDKYSAAIFNGYLDIAQQIAHAKNIELGNGFDSQTNQTSIFYVKIFFYGFLLYGIVMIIRRKLYRMRHTNE